MLAHDTGVLSATTAFGKTVVAAWLIAQRGVNTLVLVHRRQLLEQWVERLSTFLDLPAKAIGRIGGGRKKPTGSLDVAVIQSLVRKGVVDDRVAEYGHLIVDECHHLSAHSFEQVVRRAKAKFVTGLVGHRHAQGRPPSDHLHAVRPGAASRRREERRRPRGRSSTPCWSGPRRFSRPGAADPDERVQFQELYQRLDRRRRAQSAHLRRSRSRPCGRPVAAGADRTQRAPRSPRASSCRRASVTWSCFAAAWARSSARRSLLDWRPFPQTRNACFWPPGKYIGEGFDDARLDTLFLTLPVSWRGTIAQYVGRLHRLHDGKREVRVYDYADLNVPMLARMFDRRCRGYEAVGYTILLPASAVPGWPADVALPVDPQWKSDYAASVRRLVRDGVDAPLANLFVHAARADCRPMPKAPSVRGVRPRRFSTAGWRRLPDDRVGSA